MFSKAFCYIFVIIITSTCKANFNFRQIPPCKEYYRACQCDTNHGIIYCDEQTRPEGIAKLKYFIDFQFYRVMFVEKSTVRHLKDIDSFNGIIFVKKCVLCMTTGATCFCTTNFQSYVNTNQKHYESVNTSGIRTDEARLPIPTPISTKDLNIVINGRGQESNKITILFGIMSAILSLTMIIITTFCIRQVSQQFF